MYTYGQMKRESLCKPNPLRNMKVGFYMKRKKNIASTMIRTHVPFFTYLGTIHYIIQKDVGSTPQLLSCVIPQFGSTLLCFF